MFQIFSLHHFLVFMLGLILILLFFSIIILTLFNQHNTQLIKNFAIIVSGIILILSITFLLNFNKTFNPFGLDEISVFLFVLIALLTFLCILIILNQKPLKYYVLSLLIIELLLFLALLKF